MAFDINETGRAAKDAAFSLQALSGDEKNKALCAVADALIKNSALIISENAKDVAAAKEKGRRTDRQVGASKRASYREDQSSHGRYRHHL